MSLGLLGRKVGMTRIFTDDGETVPVTVIDVSNNRVAQIKSAESDGYCAVQLAFGSKRARRVTKPLAGHLAKAGAQGASVMREFTVAADQLSSLKPGEVINAAIFEAGQKVDVTGVTQGKGFTGTIKRHNFSSNRASHGNSRSHNVPGSIGMAQDPVESFRASGCRDTMACSIAPPRIWRSLGSMLSDRCCWSGAQFPAPRAATS